MLTEDQIQEIKNKIVLNVNPEKIILIGSYAYGNPDNSSDIDLLIIQKTKENPHQRSLNIRKLFPDRNFGLDILVFTPEDEKKYKFIKGSILNTAYKKGKILYEQRENRTY